MKYTLTLITVFLLLNSCAKKKYTDVPQSQRPTLENNDSLFFYCNNGIDIDTFVISTYTYYEGHDKQYYREFISLNYRHVNNKTNTIVFSIGQSADNTVINVNRAVTQISNNKDTSMNFVINGENYASIYKKELDNYLDSIPRTIYYSQTLGVVRYDYSDSLFYEISKK